MKTRQKCKALLLALALILQAFSAASPAAGEETVSNQAALPTGRAIEREAKTYTLPGTSIGDWQIDTVLKLESSSGGLAEAGGELTSIPEYAAFELEISFTAPANNILPDYDGLIPGDRIEFGAPSWIWSLSDASLTAHNPLRSGNEMVGEWWFEDGKTVIRYDDAFISQNRYGTSTHLKLTGIVDTRTATAAEPMVFSILQDVYSIPVTERTDEGAVCNVSFSKLHRQTVHSSGEGDRTTGAGYQLAITAEETNNKDLNGLSIRDEFSVQEVVEYAGEAARYDVDFYNQYIQYRNPGFTIVAPDGSTRTDGTLAMEPDPSGAAATFTYDGKLHPGEQMIITYDVDFDEGIYKDHPRAEKLNSATDTSEGDRTNAEPGGTDRSWVHREATNQATLRSDSLAGGESIGPVNGLNAKGELKPVTFNKTWLWKRGGETEKKDAFRSVYRIAVNEGQESNIGGWTLTDDLGRYGQQIISDVVIRRQGWDGEIFDTIPLASLKDGGIAGGNASGSDDSCIRYTFPEGEYKYYFTYTAEYTDKAGKTGSFECQNGAVLAEPETPDGNGGHTYGAYDHHTVPAATVTKRYESKQVSDGTITWHATIGKGIDATANSEFYDFVGWKYKTADGSEKKASFALDADDPDRGNHTIDTAALQLVILSGDPDESPVTLAEGTDYTVSPEVLDDGSRLKNASGHPVSNADEVILGFRIRFLRDIPGPLNLEYKTQAQFDRKETFVNKCWYYRDGADAGQNPIYYWATTDYSPEGSILKQAEYVASAHDREDGKGSPIIKWHLSVNKEHYETNVLIVRDTIPEGLDFDLERDLQVRWIEYGSGRDASNRPSLEDYREAYLNDRNAPYDTWPTKKAKDPGAAVNMDNRFFRATYDAATRELRIVLYDMAFKKVEFNVYTHPTADRLAASSKENPAAFDNTVEVWTGTADGTPGRRLAQWGASASVWYAMVDKTCDYSVAPNARYTVTVNPAGERLGTGEWLTVSDVPSANADIRIIFDSLQVRAGNRELTVVRGREPEAGECALAMTDSNPSAGSFELKIPNGAPVTITYDAQVEGWAGSTPDLSNAVTLRIQGVREITKEYTEKTQFIVPSASASGMNRIRVRKTEEGRNDVLLDGAEFTITEKETGAAAGTIRTGDAGRGIASTYYSDSTGSHNLVLGNGIVYVLTETKAPAGYLLPKNPEIAQFVFVTGGEENAAEIIPAYRNEGIHVIYSGNYSYELQVTNTPGRELPATGGGGTALYLAIGTVLMLAAGLILAGRKRRG